MKDTIDDESKVEYVYYRIQRALETLDEAFCAHLPVSQPESEKKEFSA